MTGAGFIKELTKQEALRIISEDPEKAADMLVALTKTVNLLIGRVNELTDKVERLEQQVATNSRNSSKPPSSDGYEKPSPKSLRQQTGKKSGGQPGHEGKTLNRVIIPDETVYTELPQNCTCGLSLVLATLETEESRQVFDTPPPVMNVTEYINRTVRCGCGKLHSGAFPSHVTAPVQYGPRIKAIAVYLNQFQHVPYERTCEALADLLGCKISSGTVRNMLRECYQKTEPAEEAIKTHIAASKVIHVDETGMRVNGRLMWTHSASTETATHYQAHARRGTEGSNAAGILSHFLGTAVHDGWKPYVSFPCEHGLRNAHHLRELVFVEEECKQSWATDMKKLLLDIKQAVASARGLGASVLDDASHSSFLRRYDEVIQAAYTTNSQALCATPGKRGRPKKSKPLNLIERLDTQRSSVLRFMNDFSVPFDNNLAERDIRMVKLKMKVSGCFRSTSGSEIFSRIRGYLSTAHKNGINSLTALLQAFDGNPFLIEGPE